MNRLVLIGNGFDLAHGLKTSYMDFINWYWDQRLHNIILVHEAVSRDELCCLELKTESGYKDWFSLAYQNSFFKDLKNEWKISGWDFIKIINKKPAHFRIVYSPYFERIIKGIETKGWVDIENDYYELLKKYVLESAPGEKIEELHKQLRFLQEKLIEYLSTFEITEKLLNTGIRQKIYAPFKDIDISLEGQKALKEHVEYGLNLDNNILDAKFFQYGSICYTSGYVEDYRRKYDNKIVHYDEIPNELMLPNHLMLLNFNYTHTAQLYCKDGAIFSVNQIHGDLDNPKSVVFGYGDELDNDYKAIVDKNDNRYLGNIKSIKYLEADNYRKVLSFIESEPYQIIIMGHSCGNSDRTLLNTLFEHKNCVSIKPYYYKRSEDDDNYIELVQNISRNFKDMKLMRDRVVNKTYCEPLVSVSHN